jgi:hypothetical protein
MRYFTPTYDLRLPQLAVSRPITDRAFFRHRVIPQAISVRYGLYVGAHFAPLVLILMFLFGKFSLIPYFSSFCSYIQLDHQLPSPIPSRRF